LSSWERIAARQLRALRLDRVRSKILAFSVLATLIPSVATAWLAYTQSKRALTEKISTELVGVSSQAANELGLWLKERMYDLRIFSNSYEVTENLSARIPAGHVTNGRLANYLNSVRERFPDYRELVVFDLSGHPVASSPAGAAVRTLPTGWEGRIRLGDPILGTARWDSTAGTMAVVLAVPVQPTGGSTLGALAVKLDLKEAHAALRRFTRGHQGEAHLFAANGERLLSSHTESPVPSGGRLTEEALRRLEPDSHPVAEYANPEGINVIGTMRPVQGSTWSVVVELPQEEGYGQVHRLRTLTVMVLGGLFVFVGLLAYWLGLLLVRPLDRLNAGATEVAKGNLDVQLPLLTGGELGSLTEAFNNMVAQLRKGRQEVQEIHEELKEKNAQLEHLSLTDPLTGLYNRRHLMSTLEAELRRAARNNERFSILILDVDHFKSYNDAFGHQAGDEALMKVAAVLRSSLREVDCAARYGGEEFVALLPDTGIDQATEVAERVRGLVRREPFTGGVVTLSVGVAEYPTHGVNLETLIADADAALYLAKRHGRDRVIRADWSDRPMSAVIPR
jgi:diguanylate cyclase (GGDEF)-like protein